MAHRKITDAFENEWDVWDVVPASIDRRMSAAILPKDRRKANRGVEAALTRELQKGWLAFQSRHERRRIAPVPPGWDTFSDAQLLELLDRASRLGKPSRLVE